MKNEPVIELAPIRLAPHATEADLLQAADALQRELLDGNDGFAGRVLLKRSDREYLDIVLWHSAEAAQAMMEAAASSAACAAFFACMVMGDDPAEGVEHLALVRSYGLSIPENATAAAT